MSTVDNDLNRLSPEQRDAWDRLSNEERADLIKAEQQAKQQFERLAQNNSAPLQDLLKGWSPIQSEYQARNPVQDVRQHDMKGAYLKPEFQELAKSIDPAIAYLTQMVHDHRASSPVAALWKSAGSTLAQPEANYNDMVEMPSINPAQFNVPIPSQTIAAQQGTPVQVEQEPTSQPLEKTSTAQPTDLADVNGRMIKDPETGELIPIDGGFQFKPGKGLLGGWK